MSKCRIKECNEDARYGRKCRKHFIEQGASREKSRRIIREKNK